MPLLIPQSRQRQMRWKNGGGITCEVARFPQDSSLDSFDWRVSVATVQQGGPFSAFPGVDRSLAILEGKGIVLDIGGATRQLTPCDPALRFDGAAVVRSALISGGIVDFNVMTRRAAYTHTLERLAVSGQITLPGGTLTLLYVIQGRCRLAGDDKLHAGDAVLFDEADAPRLLHACSAEAMLVRLHRCDAAVAA